MARLTLVSTEKKSANGQASDLRHRAAPTEGESARILMEQMGFVLKKESPSQLEFKCPFHEEPGEVPRNKSGAFYINKTTSQYYCQAIQCNEKGNLTTLERHFGFDPQSDPTYVTMESRLETYQSALTPERRKVFYDHGLNDTTIDRFRFGYDVDKRKYVIPYLGEGKRPKAFRFYNPTPGTYIDKDGKEQNEPKYLWEEGVNITLWNGTDAIGSPDGAPNTHPGTEGIVFICEGEQKAAILCQMGLAAVAIPGAGLFKKEWVAEFVNAKKIIVVFDFDAPEFHRYKNCKHCGTVEKEDCKGHNPGQMGALRTCEMLGWKAKNIVLPCDNGNSKTDLNDYFTRDGHTLQEFLFLALGQKSGHVVESLADIMLNPPAETTWLIEGVLPTGGRLLVTGAPKVGKSIWIQNLVLSLATGVPFLRRFKVDHPTRVLLLDRELSRRSLFDRFMALIEDRPGFKAGLPNLLPDHDHNLKLDQKGALETLVQLVEQNGVEVIVFDTAYKFFSGDMESSSAVAKAFDVLDQLIKRTGVSVILTHHHRKGSGAAKGKEEAGHPDQVVGSFLWTGWPNGTVLLNFAKDRVREPFTTICSFTAFRDCAPPDPLMLHRTRESISYTAISDYHPDDERDFGGVTSIALGKPTVDTVGSLLLDMQPCIEADFLHKAGSLFKCSPATIKTVLLDLLDQSNDFVRSGNGSPQSPHVIKLNVREEESWDAEHQGRQTTVNEFITA
jgi:hypothetical protein